MTSWTQLPPDVVLAHGDCREALRQIPDDYADSCVTDPPYGLSKEPDAAEVLRHWLAGDPYEHGSRGFMGRTWDSFVPGPEYWREVRRVLKPGAHLLAFSSVRTWDLLSLAIRLAGFENRDTIGCPTLAWVQGQGFPKSHDISKAIDRAAGATREVVGEKVSPDGVPYSARKKTFQTTGGNNGWKRPSDEANPRTEITAPSTDDAKRWSGWGTALKPGWEVVLVFRKPFPGTVASNVAAYGTGALSVDACRIGTGAGGDRNGEDSANRRYGDGKDFSMLPGPRGGAASGRWPSNLVLVHAEGCRSVGTRTVPANGSIDKDTAAAASRRTDTKSVYGDDDRERGTWEPYGNGDGTETVEAWECVDGCPVRGLDTASRYFYQAKASGEDRWFLCRLCGTAHPRRQLPEHEHGRGKDRKHIVQHSTVKPTDLMRWLCRLVTRPGGTIVDPFMGTASTGIAALREGFKFIGVDSDPDYCVIARTRVEHELRGASVPSREATAP